MKSNDLETGMMLINASFNTVKVITLMRSFSTGKMHKTSSVDSLLS